MLLCIENINMYDIVIIVKSKFQTPYQRTKEIKSVFDICTVIDGHCTMHTLQYAMLGVRKATL